MRNVSPGFVTVLGSRLVAGRDMTWHDMYQGLPVAMISENMARELWGEPRAALGKRIRASLTQEWREVIGVSADLRDEGVMKSAPTIVYWPLLQKAPNGVICSAQERRLHDPQSESRLGPLRAGVAAGAAIGEPESSAGQCPHPGRDLREIDGAHVIRPVVVSGGRRHGVSSRSGGDLRCDRLFGGAAKERDWYPDRSGFNRSNR